MDLQHINLLDLLGGGFKQKTHNEYAGPCPFCGGKDRFIVWTQPEQRNPRFWCRQCNKSGDAIDLLTKRDNLSFAEAIDRMGVTTDAPSQSNPRRQAPRKKLVSEQGKSAALTDPAWQQAAQNFVETSAQRLWETQGRVALNYLHQRGLTDEVIRTAQLGFHPAGTHMTWGSESVWLYSGIVIPWLIESRYWKVNIRRKPSELKPDDNRYKQARLMGKHSANGLNYAAWTFQS
jgi:DNA primase